MIYYRVRSIDEYGVDEGPSFRGDFLDNALRESMAWAARMPDDRLLGPIEIRDVTTNKLVERIDPADVRHVMPQGLIGVVSWSGRLE